MNFCKKSMEDTFRNILNLGLGIDIYIHINRKGRRKLKYNILYNQSFSQDLQTCSQVDR